MAGEINLTATASCFELGAPGQGIPCRSWGTASECRAAAVLVHGLGGHSAWFEAFGRRLKVRSIYAIAYDQLGFGKRLDDNFVASDQWLGDLRAVVAHIKAEVGDRPLYIMGNSMGGVVAYAAVASKLVSPQALILFSPAFDGYPGTFTIGFRLKAILKGLVNPATGIQLPYDDDHISQQESVKSFILTDPQRRKVVPARMLLELLKLTTRYRTRPGSIDCPVLMMTAGTDRIVDNKACEQFFRQLVCPGKIRKHYSAAWHDLMFDPVIDQVADDVVDFMASTAPDKILAGS